VEATKIAIDKWLSRKTVANAVHSFHVKKPKDLPFILGEKGEFVRSKEENSNAECTCRMPLRRTSVYRILLSGRPYAPVSIISSKKDSF
jgi:hypothetical protein